MEYGIGQFIFELLPRAAHLEIGELVFVTNVDLVDGENEQDK